MIVHILFLALIFFCFIKDPDSSDDLQKLETMIFIPIKEKTAELSESFIKLKTVGFSVSNKICTIIPCIIYHKIL